MSFQNLNDGNSMNYQLPQIWRQPVIYGGVGSMVGMGERAIQRQYGVYQWFGGGKAWLASIVLLMVFCVNGGKVFADSDPPLIDELLQSVSSDSCQATYSAPEQTLSVPCVTVTDIKTGKTLSYAVKMQQIAETNPLQFAVSSFAENKDNPPNPCQASYSLESGELSLPCITVSDQATDKTWSYHAKLQQIMWTQPRRFVVNSLAMNEDRSPNLCLPTDSLGSGESLLPCMEIAIPSTRGRNLRSVSTPDLARDEYSSGGTIDNPFDQQPEDWFYQCTRYAFGRAYEKMNVILEFSVNGGRNAGRWYDLILYLPRGQTPKPSSLASWQFCYVNARGEQDCAGHVAFVESVDANGQIIFTEANVHGRGEYDNFSEPLSEQEFEGRFTGFNGYVYLQSLELDSAITVNPSPVLQNQPIKISVKISNRNGTTDYFGNLYAAFHPKGDVNQSPWEIKLIDKPLPASKDFEYVFDSTINDNSSQSTSRNVTLSPGEYDLYIKGNDFQPITGGGFPNPITVVVSGGQTSEDDKKANIILNAMEKHAKVGIYFPTPPLMQGTKNGYIYRVYQQSTSRNLLAVKDGKLYYSLGMRELKQLSTIEVLNKVLCQPNPTCW